MRRTARLGRPSVRQSVLCRAGFFVKNKKSRKSSWRERVYIQKINDDNDNYEHSPVKKQVCKFSVQKRT